MKKYLMTGIAALTLGGIITSCSHDMDQYTGGNVTENIQKDYETKFVSRFGEPASTQDWGFGSTSVAGVRGGTRTVPGIEFPDDFSDKTDITEPNKNNFGKPSITKNDATVSTGSYNEWPSINSGSTVYLEEGAVLRLYNEWWPDGSITLQNVNLYMSKGSRLEVPSGLNISGTTKLVNDEGTIVIGSDDNKKNIWVDNFKGIFWNNGSIEGIQDIGTSNDGGTFYFGSETSFTANNISLNKQVKFWNEGEITLNGKFEAKEYGHEIYNSGTITTPKINLPKETVLWNEGTITAANSKEIDFSVSNDKVQIYNGTNATLKLETLTFNNNKQLVINDGTLNVKGKITIPNNSEIVNYSKLTGGSFEMLSGSKFYNVSGGEVTIDGLSKITNDGSGNNKDNVWMNSGKYTTGSFEATGGCQNPAGFNNCHMTVTGKFFMNHSNFVLDGGAAVECGSFEWNSDNYFHMGGKALLKVTGQLLSKNQNSSPQYGFWGDDTDYAVIQAGSIAKESEGQYRAAYYGNLFIDTNNHFAQGGTNAQPWYYFDSSVKFSFNDNSTSPVKKATKAENFSITIPKDNNGCTPGYTWGDEIESVRVIAEDLTVNDVNADFDFNDVVFDVKWNKTQDKVSVKVLAAGGELTLYIGGTEAGVEGVRTVNSRFADANPDKKNDITEKTMINTAEGKHNEYNTFEYDLSKEEWKGSDIKEIAKSIYVRVMKSNELITLPAVQGKATAKIAVGTDYDWCNERQNIDEKFENFRGFVKGEYSWDTWYKNQNQ